MALILNIFSYEVRRNELYLEQIYPFFGLLSPLDTLMTTVDETF